jgi:hypothetical protein
MYASPAVSVPTRLPRYYRVEKYPPIRIGRPKRLILEAIGKFHYLTAQQSTLLLFSSGSLTYTQDHLKELFHAGYVRRIFLPKSTPLGSSLAIYALDNAGYRYLQGLGLAPEGRFRPSEQAKREELYLEHTLAANSCLILPLRLAKQNPNVRVAEVITERQMKKSHPVRVKDPAGNKGESVYVVPDGWYKLIVDDKYEYPFAVELDRGTILDKDKWKRKIRSLLEYEKSAYQELFGTSYLTVLFIVPDQKRLEIALKWSEDELKRLHAEHQADLFRFAAFDPHKVDDVHGIFYGPVWTRPFGGRQVSLIGGQNGIL